MTVSELEVKYLTFKMYIFFFLHIRCFIFIYFLAVPQGIWDLSSPTRDWMSDPCSGSVES